ncbi:winged helix-turn-helix domain-containing protein [Leisingera caerulea]|uniref:winged helix-turn-helix domain-containing protein n=1 Tax=Leisingera caerulea TaxID=506591 RepID=UPI003F4A9782
MYRFDEFEFDPAGAGLRKRGRPIALEPQALQLLEVLIRNRARVVSKDDLIADVWQGRAITDAALNTRIRSVRRALGDDGARQRYVKTFPKRGYRFVADVKSCMPPAAARGRKRPGLAAAFAALAVLLVAALFWLWPVQNSGIDSRPSLAVLRFEVLDGQGVQPYFADGLTEDLTTHLARFRELFVISAATMRSYPDDPAAQLRAARDLGVSHALRGSVRRDEGRIRITAELASLPEGRTVWSEQFEREPAGVFAIQDEITRAIAGRLLPEIVLSQAAALTARPTDDPGAWDLFLRGRFQQGILTAEAQTEAVRLARLAAAKDPGFAAARSLEARALGTLFFHGWAAEGRAVLDQAIAAAQAAIRLDGNDPQAHAALGYIYRFTGEAEPAIANLERAAELNPNDARIRLELAHTLDWFRLQARALPEIEMAIRLSPRDPLLHAMYFYKGHILFHLGRYEEALEAARQMRAVAKGPVWQVYAQLLRAANLARLERSQEAQAAVEAALAINPKLSVAAMRKQFEGSKNHPENRRIWLESLQAAGLPVE